MRALYAVVLLLIISVVADSFRSQPNLYLKRGLEGRGKVIMQGEQDFLPIWLTIKSISPPIITGAWKEKTGDDKPGQAIYNLVFVRMPTILCGLWYSSSLLKGGGGFALDIGTGPVDVGPTGVALVLYLILLRQE